MREAQGAAVTRLIEVALLAAFTLLAALVLAAMIRAAVPV